MNKCLELLSLLETEVGGHWNSKVESIDLPNSDLTKEDLELIKPEFAKLKKKFGMDIRISGNNQLTWDNEIKWPSARDCEEYNIEDHKSYRMGRYGSDDIGNYTYDGKVSQDLFMSIFKKHGLDKKYNVDFDEDIGHTAVEINIIPIKKG